MQISTLIRKVLKGKGKMGAQRAKGKLGFLLTILILIINYKEGIKLNKNLHIIIVYVKVNNIYIKLFFFKF